MKGTVHVRSGRRTRSFVVNVAGTGVHVRTARGAGGSNTIVAIGMHLDREAVHARIAHALEPIDGSAPIAGVRRLDRLRRLSAPATAPASAPASDEPEPGLDFGEHVGANAAGATGATSIAGER